MDPTLAKLNDSINEIHIDNNVTMNSVYLDGTAYNKVDTMTPTPNSISTTTNTVDISPTIKMNVNTESEMVDNTMGFTDSATRTSNVKIASKSANDSIIFSDTSTTSMNSNKSSETVFDIIIPLESSTMSMHLNTASIVDDVTTPINLSVNTTMANAVSEPVDNPNASADPIIMTTNVDIELKAGDPITSIEPSTMKTNINSMPELVRDAHTDSSNIIMDLNTVPKTANDPMTNIDSSTMTTNIITVSKLDNPVTFSDLSTMTTNANTMSDQEKNIKVTTESYIHDDKMPSSIDQISKMSQTNTSASTPNSNMVQTTTSSILDSNKRDKNDDTNVEKSSFVPGDKATVPTETNHKDSTDSKTIVTTEIATDQYLPTSINSYTNNPDEIKMTIGSTTTSEYNRDKHVITTKDSIISNDMEKHTESLPKQENLKHKNFMEYIPVVVLQESNPVFKQNPNLKPKNKIKNNDDINPMATMNAPILETAPKKSEQTDQNDAIPQNNLPGDYKSETKNNDKIMVPEESSKVDVPTLSNRFAENINSQVKNNICQHNCNEGRPHADPILINNSNQDDIYQGKPEPYIKHQEPENMNTNQFVQSDQNSQPSQSFTTNIPFENTNQQDLGSQIPNYPFTNFGLPNNFFVNPFQNAFNNFTPPVFPFNQFALNNPAAEAAAAAFKTSFGGANVLSNLAQLHGAPNLFPDFINPSNVQPQTFSAPNEAPQYNSQNNENNDNSNLYTDSVHLPFNGLNQYPDINSQATTSNFAGSGAGGSPYGGAGGLGGPGTIGFGGGPSGYGGGNCNKNLSKFLINFYLYITF